MIWAEKMKQLSANLPEPETLEWTYCRLMGLDKLAWVNLQRSEILPTEEAKLTEVAERLSANEPPQYILGWAEFCDLKFKANKKVLIPREETEELVREVLAAHTNDEKLTVLDIGTGSGAIAISLAKARPNWTVLASDISQDALDVAAENARDLGVTVLFARSSVFDTLMGAADIIVSNPPYIDPNDWGEVDANVLLHEPRTALFADHEGYVVYEKLAAGVKEHLSERGEMYLEIGYKQGTRVRTLFETLFDEVLVKQDMNGKDRYVLCRGFKK
ncbi:MAG: peptide chain release factor N(5)-glutamine methyltransferase [Streptococcaceae bacterium]|jgi:release factor glutamine methyltransferase|nr:peptide chain release factor N(5)-glutamine methyltransferase [Streptococcaceae bacterium]